MYGCRHISAEADMAQGVSRTGQVQEEADGPLCSGVKWDFPAASGGRCPVTQSSSLRLPLPGTPSSRLILFPLLINRPKVRHQALIAQWFAVSRSQRPPFQPSSSWQSFSCLKGTPGSSLSSQWGPLVDG